MTSLVETRAASAEPDDPPDVVDLVWRLRANERSAVAEVYDRHHEVLRRFARRLLGNDAAAEDLVHDVFLHLPKAIRRFEGRSSLRTFLVSVAANRCRHHVRAAIRYRRATERYAEHRAPTRPVQPDERHAQREMAERLARALDELPVDQRVAFVLSVIEGRTNAEVALITDVPEVTVRTRVLRARQKLKALLEGERTDG
ncbi:MAG: RNA polymerase sigma factor [Sandaracinaceae bacterium]|nr:RNA polymerase sigma factor [Sandaracinaceae bacterium]